MVDGIGSLNSICRFWPLIVISCISGAIATVVCRKIAIKTGLVDRPDGLVKTHTEPTAYLGGIGIFIGFAVGIFAAMILLRSEDNYGQALKWLTGVMCGGAIACLTGVIDDVAEIRPWQKVLGQVLAGAALLVAGIGPNLNYLMKPLGVEMPPVIEELAGFVIILIFVLGATNSLNLLDGIDGLCAGVTAVIAFGMLGLAVLLGEQRPDDFSNTVRYIVALVLLGSVCGFLPFNWNPAKIFMGDAGSLFLGVTAASMMVMFLAAGVVWGVASIVIFGLPILDTAVAFARRWINKQPLFVADRGHIYDQMMDRGNELKKTVKMCYGISGAYALAGVVISQMSVKYAFLAAMGVFVVSGVVVWYKGFLKMTGLRGTVGQVD